MANETTTVPEGFTTRTPPAVSRVHRDPRGHATLTTSGLLSGPGHSTQNQDLALRGYRAHASTTTATTVLGADLAVSQTVTVTGTKANFLHQGDE
jgi:hypothetical protein